MRNKFTPAILAGFVISIFFITPQPVMAGTLIGEVNVAGGKKLKNVVVYLKPMDELANAVVKHQRITQKGRRFNPKVSVIVAGGSASFVNDEDQEIDHNVYSLSKTRKFDIGLAAQSSVHTVNFPKPGVVKYFCSVHKNMDGIIVVVPSPFFAVLDEPGQFKLDQVPAGTWELNAALSHRRYAAKPVIVTVKNQALSNIELKIARKKRKR